MKVQKIIFSSHPAKKFFLPLAQKLRYYLFGFVFETSTYKKSIRNLTSFHGGFFEFEFLEMFTSFCQKLLFELEMFSLKYCKAYCVKTGGSSLKRCKSPKNCLKKIEKQKEK